MGERLAALQDRMASLNEMMAAQTRAATLATVDPSNPAAIWLDFGSR